MNVKTSHPPLELGQAHTYLERVIVKLKTLDARQKQPLVEILQYISDYIGRTRSEICALRPTKDGEKFSSSTDELEEVVQETADAAGSIMTAAEAIEAIALKLPQPTSDELMAAVTKIYEASAFQDITGQRITKVVRVIQNAEKRIEALLCFCSDSELKPCGSGCGNHGTPPDDTLLNGPQTQKTANSQSDIDRMLAELG
jgi:chemotaxis protein CheZ